MMELYLYGIWQAFDEVIANGLKRQLPVQEIVAHLLKAETAEKKARSERRLDRLAAANAAYPAPEVRR